MTHSLLGPIIKCQVSAQHLIQDGRYVDSDIVEADELHIDLDGVVGWCDGRAVLNHHHRLHPKRATWKPHRLLSIGFTGHYEAMRDRFGAAPLGCAAENVIIDQDRVITEAELARGLQLRTADGSVLDLEPAAVAKPCVPFTKYLLKNQEAEPEEVTPNRAFLEGGMRGFVFGLANQVDGAVLQPGDELWLAD